MKLTYTVALIVQLTLAWNGYWRRNFGTSHVLYIPFDILWLLIASCHYGASDLRNLTFK